ncbi:hypothetical protein IQ266_25110 [filamentous cyanobacterium LEGE 11480]|uniref:Uncharacterized protein n=1 Tax=Romeriopsis navalis LEGE 11480 TaxID=2777977 RepID=A0A928Z7B0_9CYAN|nr:hypothetical protein [Romeriopsis navalis]MBE9033020.1 hypothetical protein [Romeriopsis navalis LEGE 11480]
MRQTTYRLWDSSQTFIDISTSGWLEDAIKASGMLAPWHAQFHSDGHFLNVTPSAVNAAIKSVRQEFA